MVSPGTTNQPPCGDRVADATQTDPQRVQLRRTAGWKMPPNTMKVDRTTRWGNPFGPPYCYPALAVDLFRDLISGFFSPSKLKHLSDVDFSRVYEARIIWLTRIGCSYPRDALYLLKGKNLACWCKPGDPCHADVLLELANQPPPPAIWERSEAEHREAINPEPKTPINHDRETER